VAYVRPHDVVLRRTDDRSRSDDAALPGEATVRFVSALGAKAWVELSYEAVWSRLKSPAKTSPSWKFPAANTAGFSCGCRASFPRIHRNRPESCDRTRVSDC